MSTLLIRLAAPMQSWGEGSKFSRRDTKREPTKSGVIGLIAAALGRRREDDITDLAELKFGVRKDQPGTLLRDYHTAHNNNDAFISERYYLADAVFLAGIEGNETLLKEIDNALRSPVFPLFLGRRSCPPVGEVSLGVREAGLLEALSSHEWLAHNWYKRKLKRRKEEPELEIVYDSPDGIITRDLPISYNQAYRRYGYRTSKRCFMNTAQTSHDAFEALGGDADVPFSS